MQGSHDDAEYALTPHANVAEIQVVGALSDHVIRHIGIETLAQSVFLHQLAVKHIVGQRGVDATFVLEHMPKAVLHPMYAGRDRRDRKRALLVEFVKPMQRYLCVALKFLCDRGDQADEIWVSTGHPMGTESLRRCLKQGRLTPVVGRE